MGSNLAHIGVGQVSPHTVYSIKDRLAIIAKQIDKSEQDPSVRLLALEIVRGVAQHGEESEDAELARVFWWVKNNIEYRGDPRNYDLYANAIRTIQSRAGDCDCHCALISSVLSNLGYLVGAKVISPDDKDWHIYAVCGVRSKASPSAYVALDTTQPGSFPGWEPGDEYRKYEMLATFKKGKVTNTQKLRWG